MQISNIGGIMEISAKVVKELREKTGAGMMDCKKALKEVDGDFEKAVDYLRTKGIAAAQKRVGKSTNEGLIEAYIHPGSKLGVLIEVNCETDFVARTDDFNQFVRDIAMQIAAANPAAVNKEEIDKDYIEKELTIYREQMKDQGKPDNIIDKIAQGKLEKHFKEVVLLEQAFVKDSNVTIKDLVTQISAKLGENITIRRFSRFQLGA